MSMMNKLNGALEKYFLPVAMKISGKYIFTSNKRWFNFNNATINSGKYFLNLWIFTYTWISRAYDKNIW